MDRKVDREVEILPCWRNESKGAEKGKTNERYELADIQKTPVQTRDILVLHNCPSAQLWLRSCNIYSRPRVWSKDLNAMQLWLYLSQPAGIISICFYIHFSMNFTLLEISLKPTSSVDMCNMKSSRWIGSVDGDNTLATLHGSNCSVSTWLGRNVKANAEQMLWNQ